MHSFEMRVTVGLPSLPSLSSFEFRSPLERAGYPDRSTLERAGSLSPGAGRRVWQLRSPMD